LLPPQPYGASHAQQGGEIADLAAPFHHLVVEGGNETGDRAPFGRRDLFRMSQNAVSRRMVVLWPLSRTVRVSCV